MSDFGDHNLDDGGLDIVDDFGDEEIDIMVKVLTRLNYNSFSL
jgi:hypothetical protein